MIIYNYSEVNEMAYIAHYRQADETEQLLAVHLKEVQQHCEEIGAKLNIRHMTGLVGVLHDFGKYSDEFQAYIREAVANPDKPPKRGSVNHSTAGGWLLVKSLKNNRGFSELLANVIYGHHGTLLDFINLDGNSPFLNRETNRTIEIDDLKVMRARFFNEVMSAQAFSLYVKSALEEYEALKLHKNEKEIMQLNFFLTKYLFSALIDADRTNARCFEEKTTRQQEQGECTPFSVYEQRLNDCLAIMQREAIPNAITKQRQYLSDQCFQKAHLPTGIYTLSIPTGGGKTLASLRFALAHAQKNKQQRIINIIPFTTIIEQNAAEVREILQTEELLEHHSNIITETEIDAEHMSYQKQQQLRQQQSAKDNWDAPLIFSTVVQFLEIVYSEKSRYARRFHNLANSVLIFDEIQTLPIKTISLFNAVAMFLKEFCNTTLILCTATQPALTHVQHALAIDGELIDDLEDVMPAFKRTNVVSLVRPLEWSVEEVAALAKEQLARLDSVLIIVNTKRAASELYALLEQEGIAVTHLSTAMCPQHRKDILGKKQDDLHGESVWSLLNSGRKQICISTQLIEAGVDVSFQCVIRTLAGLDSIAQAAGRCNRNGEVASRDVFVVNMKPPSERYLPSIAAGIDQSAIIMRDMNADPFLYQGEMLATEAMFTYFVRYYDAMKTTQNYNIPGGNLYELAFSRNEKFVGRNAQHRALENRHAFKTIGQLFNVIDSETIRVLVPYGDVGKDLINQLEGQETIDFKRFLKVAQHYSVNVFHYQRRELERSGMLAVYETPFSKIYYVREGAYSKKDGLKIEGNAALNALLI